MIRKYNWRDALKGTPRVIIHMNIYDAPLEIGFNEHYSLDTPLPEALEDFFKSMRERNPTAHIDLKRSKLEIEYVDLPKEVVIKLN